MAKGRPRKTQGGDVLLRSAELIGWALGGLEREIVETRHRLEALTRQAAQLRSRVGTSGAKGRGPAAAASFDEPGVQPAAPAKKKRQMSAAARKRISDMQKKRWAEWRKKKAASPK
jgi:hypothetical protein